MKTNERKIIKIIREEYNNRLLQLFRENVAELFETDMFDAQGNQLLSPGLKVRHKKSNYEYTVDHVEGKGDDAIVFLRHPEDPRFKAPGSEEQLAEGEDEPEDLQRIKVKDVDLNKIMGGEEPGGHPGRYSSMDPMQAAKAARPARLLKVTRKEFEKEYEVK